MCKLLPLIARNTDEASVNLLLSQLDRGTYKRRVGATQTAVVEPLLRAGEVEFQLFRGMCDCDSFLGAGHRTLDAQMRCRTEDYRLKGWSEAKTTRAVRDFETTQLRGGYAGLRSGQSEDGAYWVTFMSHLRARLGLQRLGLVQHWSRGMGARDVFPTSRRDGGVIAHAVPVLGAMTDGVIYDVSLDG